MVNRKSASLLVCLALVLNMTVSVNNKDQRVYWDNYQSQEEVTEEVKDLTKALEKYFLATNSLGIQDDLGLTEEDYQDLLKYRRNDLCTYDELSNVEEIFEQIKSNNKDFINDNKAYIDPLMDEYYNGREYNNRNGLKVSPNDFEKIKELIISSLKSHIQDTINNGYPSNLHVLSDLKIVFTREKEGNYGSYIMDQNLVKINIYEILDDVSNLDELLIRIKEVFYHELDHALQEPCLDEKEKGITASTLQVDDGNISFKDEADAEDKAIYELWQDDLYAVSKNDFNFTYDGYRKLKSQLSLCFAFDNNKNLRYYYKVMNSHDNNLALEYFGCASEAEKKELLRVLYAMNSLEERTDYLEKVNGSKGDYSEQDKEKLLDEIKYLQNISIMKFSLKSLINYNLHTYRLSLEENVLAYYLIISNLVNSSFIENDNECVYYQEFLDEYQKLQESYFELLSKMYSVDLNEIKKVYEDIKFYEINYELGCLYGKLNGDENYLNDAHYYDEMLTGLLKRFPILKGIAFINYQDVKNGNYKENDWVSIIDANVAADYQIKH